MPDKKDKKPIKKAVRYEVRYRCPNPDRPPFTFSQREWLNADNDDDAKAQFERYKRVAESCSSFKLFKVTRVVKSYPKKRVITVIEECLADDNK
jgi:hypothetical protein